MDCKWIVTSPQKEGNETASIGMREKVRRTLGFRNQSLVWLGFWKETSQHSSDLAIRSPRDTTRKRMTVSKVTSSDVRTHSGITGKLSIRDGCQKYSVHRCYPVAKEIHPCIPKTAASLVSGSLVVFSNLLDVGLPMAEDLRKPGSVSLTTLKAYLMRRVEEVTISP